MGGSNLIIGDFAGLVRAIVEKTSRGEIARELGHDKQTVNRWLTGARANDDRDVAALIRLALKNDVEVDAFQTFEPIYDFSKMLSYEEKIDQGPPRLLWLADPGVQIPGFCTDLCGIKTESPLGIASSPLLADHQWAALMLNLGFGVSTLKTRRTQSKETWDPPHIAFVTTPPPLLKYDRTSPPEVEVTFHRSSVKMAIPNLVNSLGVPSEAPSIWQQTYERIHQHARGGQVGLSVIAEGQNKPEILKDVDSVVAAAAEVRPPFIEINVSCPNLEKERDPYSDFGLIAEVCRRAKRITEPKGILLVLKLAHMPEAQMKQLLEGVWKSIDAVSYRNTLKVRPICRDREGQFHAAFVGREFGGLSGPCTFELTKRGIESLAKIKRQMQLRFGIIAIGGVAKYSDVIELLNAGADVVQACTAPIFDPLLAMKVRYHLSRSTSILKPKGEAKRQAFELLLPRDQAEKDSYRELERAVAEIQRRFPQREIPYNTIVSTWNKWMATRSTSIDTGAARRVAAGRREAEWIRELL